MGQNELYIEFITWSFFKLEKPESLSKPRSDFYKLRPFGERRWRGGGEGEVFALTTSFMSTTGGTFSGAKNQFVIIRIILLLTWLNGELADKSLGVCRLRLHLVRLVDIDNFVLGFVFILALC